MPATATEWKCDRESGTVVGLNWLCLGVVECNLLSRSAQRKVQLCALPVEKHGMNYSSTLLH